MIHRLIYEHELPSEGGLVLSDFVSHLSGSLVTFHAGDIIPKDKLSRLVGVERLPIRDLSKNPPRKNVLVDIDTGEETTHAKELRKLQDESKKVKPDGE
jgi:hypothetical protein